MDCIFRKQTSDEEQPKSGSFPFVSFSISFSSVSQFSVYKSFSSLVKLIPKYFILFDRKRGCFLVFSFQIVISINKPHWFLLLAALLNLFINVFRFFYVGIMLPVNSLKQFIFFQACSSFSRLFSIWVLCVDKGILGPACSLLQKGSWNFVRDCIKSEIQFEEYCQLNNINTSIP